jgi:hypothetical protein
MTTFFLKRDPVASPSPRPSTHGCYKSSLLYGGWAAGPHGVGGLLASVVRRALPPRSSAPSPASPRFSWSGGLPTRASSLPGRGRNAAADTAAAAAGAAERPLRCAGKLGQEMRGGQKRGGRGARQRAPLPMRASRALHPTLFLAKPPPTLHLPPPRARAITLATPPVCLQEACRPFSTQSSSPHPLGLGPLACRGVLDPEVLAAFPRSASYQSRHPGAGTSPGSLGGAGVAALATAAAAAQELAEAAMEAGMAQPRTS